jgi:putative Holliday junction resolvase
MISENFKTFPRAGKLMGIDWGEKRIGLAVTDPDKKFTFARPHATDISHIAYHISQENITGVIIGLPIRSDGSDSETTKRVRAFAEKLAEQTDVPIALLDETLTSIEAIDRTRRDLGRGCDGRVRRCDRHTGDIDSESARIILENALAIMNRR